MKIFVCLFFLLSFGTNVYASDLPINLNIKNHQFEPSIINIPANTPFVLIITNLDKTIEEFESDDLKKEKLVGAGKTIKIPVSAQKPGQYKFYGDFHQKTAQGILEIK
jgi:hypothetical protein